MVVVEDAFKFAKLVSIGLEKIPADIASDTQSKARYLDSLDFLRSNRYCMAQTKDGCYTNSKVDGFSQCVLLEK